MKEFNFQKVAIIGNEERRKFLNLIMRNEVSSVDVVDMLNLKEVITDDLIPYQKGLRNYFNEVIATYPDSKEKMLPIQIWTDITFNLELKKRMRTEEQESAKE